jgi:hypothetical protein
MYAKGISYLGLRRYFGENLNVRILNAVSFDTNYYNVFKLLIYKKAYRI